MKRVLTVGFAYTGPSLSGVTVEQFGLIRTSVDANLSAFPLYEYDVILINPASYSHFIFGEASEDSDSDSELWNLKSRNNRLDLDEAFDLDDRSSEMAVAMERGATVVWCMAPPKFTKFFGTRSVYVGYCAPDLDKALRRSELVLKKGRSLGTVSKEQPFSSYFARLAESGWKVCLTDLASEFMPIATTPEGYALGVRFESGATRGWVVSPPTSEAAINQLVQDSLGVVTTAQPTAAALHGIFLSHTSVDKPFVRQLKADLLAAGAPMVWVDEAEIQIGDSLISKIDEGLKLCRYVGVVLSSKSIKAPWVQKELEVAMTKEISGGKVVVLPFLYERCELPSFLTNKLYADFTDPTQYGETLAKVVRRLKVI